MKHLSIIFLLFSVSLFSQDIEKLKQSEVLFVFHSGTNGNYQTKSVFQKFKKQRTAFYYNFLFTKKNQLTEENQHCLQKKEITFFYWHYSDFDEQANDNPAPYFEVNKSFLKKNKDVIITSDFLNKIGFRASSKLFHNAKTIFLIDKSEIKDGKIIIKEVKYSIIYDE